jgi:hypothetical protein
MQDLHYKGMLQRVTRFSDCAQAAGQPVIVQLRMS